MPLDKTTLANSIASAFNAVQNDIANNGRTAAQAQTDLATALAGAIDTYVKGATVTVSGTVATTAPSGTWPFTETSGSLS